MQRPDLEIYTKDFERVGIIDTFTSGQFERCLWEVGKMELHVSLLARYADQLKVGHIVMIDEDRAWEITAVKKSEAKHGLGLVVYGQELKGILRQRLVVPDEQDDNKHFGWDRVPTEKLDQDPPPAPGLDSKTDSEVRLVAVAGTEYRVDDGEWQWSPVFGSLDPATAYSFYARTVETWSHNASEAGPPLTVITDKGTQSVPAVPTAETRTGTTITLNTIPGAEYRMNSDEWQDSPTFTGLAPMMSYTFYARLKETPTHYPSPESAGASIMTTKADQIAPGAPTMASHTSSSITLTAISGCEYRLAGDSWQDSPTFTGLAVATAYTFYQRRKETATHEASPESPSASLSTDKAQQTAPSAPTMKARTGYMIELNAITNCEYKRDSGSWQASTVFDGLDPVTSYTFYARKKGTGTLHPSPASAGASITTTKGAQDTPPAPDVTDVTFESAKVASLPGAEVRLGAGIWFPSPKTFEDLTSETEYSAFARMPETVTHYGSGISPARIFETTAEGDDMTGTPGPIWLAGGDMDAGYFGWVPAADFITGDALALACGVTQGTPQFSNEGWLKQANNGKIQFAAKKPIRYSISWDHLLAQGCVWGDGTTGGDRTVVIDGLTYKVRLLRGLNDSYNPKAVPSGSGYNGVHCHGSEWNRLMLPIHIGAKNNSWNGYESNVESGLPYWGIDFTDTDLHTISTAGNGTYSWCQNYAYASTYRSLRGYYGAAYADGATSSVTHVRRGWRPVLELVTD